MFSIYLEAVIVGIYCIVIYLPFVFIGNIYLRFLLFGFFKHAFGYFYIHDYFCNYRNKKYKTHDHSYLIFESILEGIYFMVLGGLLFSFIYRDKKPPLLSSLPIIFTLGFMTHLLAEWTGIHKLFLNKCK
jgi:hypothetical protein